MTMHIKFLTTALRNSCKDLKPHTLAGFEPGIFCPGIQDRRSRDLDTDAMTTEPLNQVHKKVVVRQRKELIPT
jgi:hypothetical protein